MFLGKLIKGVLNMIEFVKSCIVTGAEQRTKKDNSTYILIHVLGDNGQTVSCMFKGDNNKIFDLKKMNTYDVTFAIHVGQYTALSVLDINEKTSK